MVELFMTVVDTGEEARRSHIIESTGFFTKSEDASKHIQARPCASARSSSTRARGTRPMPGRGESGSDEESPGEPGGRARGLRRRTPGDGRQS